MTKKRKFEPDDKKQSERFVKTARELGIEENGKAFERTFQSVVPRHKRSARSQKPIQKEKP